MWKKLPLWKYYSTKWFLLFFLQITLWNLVAKLCHLFENESSLLSNIKVNTFLSSFSFESCKWFACSHVINYVALCHKSYWILALNVISCSKINMTIIHHYYFYCKSKIIYVDVQFFSFSFFLSFVLKATHYPFISMGSLKV